MKLRAYFVFPAIVLLLVGCSPAPSTPIPTLVINSASGGEPTASSLEGEGNSAGVTASAEIVPNQSADLSFAGTGIIQEIKIREGDLVHAGDTLASQDNLTQLQAAVAASEANLASIQKNYEKLVASAPVIRANAQLTLLQAQKAQENAQKAAKSKQFQRATQQTIDIAKANLIVANKALDDAETIYNQNKNRSSTDVVYAAALSQLAAAQQRQQQAQYNLNYVTSLPGPLEVEIAQANLDVANANLEAAQQTWDQVKDTPDTPELAASKALLATAESNLVNAKLALERGVLKAPFEGTVVSVHSIPGEAVLPGQVIISLADLGKLLVETTDLSERDIVRVSIGQAAAIHVESLGKDYPGKVVMIAPQASKLGGDVVYQVTITFDQQPEGIRWGMSATVRIQSS